MYGPTKDDIYAFALSKTLSKVSSPATVGLYSPCENRINMILRQTEVHLDEESVRIENEHREKPRSAKPSLGDLFAVIGRLLFFNPIWSRKTRQQHNIRFMYVDFSAWHFAGSDMLWAGIVIRLCQAIALSFGKLQVALFRAAQYDEEDEVKKKVVVKTSDRWRAKKLCCFPLWLLFLIALVIPIILVIILFTSDFPIADNATVSGTEARTTQGGHKNVGVLHGLLFASLGVPAASSLKFVFEMVKNLISSQEKNVKKGMDSDRVSSRLGFMDKVRKEMWFLSRFVQFMEVFERRRIRVVLQITNLDRCSPKKIVAVLEAIDILLSDEESPFISIVAVNPHVLVQKVNFADGCLSQEDRAYALLNRIVTLAFTVPPLSDDAKHGLFYALTSDVHCPQHDDHNRNNVGTAGGKETDVLIALEESNPLVRATLGTLDVSDEEVETLVRSVLTCDERNLNKYMSDDTTSMRRVINSIRMTVIIMMALKQELPPPECIAGWVVLANQWPCRLSWILQCVEDAQQRADIDGDSASKGHDSTTLWEVFSKSRAELYVMSQHIEDLLEQDGDPEMFERFLAVDFQFTVKDLRAFEVTTVNLDYSIQKELALIRGTSRLKDTGWMRDLAPLPITTLIKMDTEDICRELERMEYPDKYVEKVKLNDLNGVALYFGNQDDLKELLDMSFGDWATFKLHFLGFRPHVRAQYKNLSLASANANGQLSNLKAHAAHHHASNFSMNSLSL